jgi:anti-sigma factor RsiW
VSEHEHERLSAYLDGELPPAEMSAVGAHVAACPECAARLAEFAAVDEAAAALAATAPSGYFEALPGRMRARVEPRR